MANPFQVQHYPVFEKGIFQKHPSLFERFLYRTSDHLRREYQKAREILPQYEGTITWPLIVGPGFCGATHPGAENIFVTAMANPNGSAYNSDCLYVNPSQKIFAISDAPDEMATSSRRLLAKLDHRLQTGSADDLEVIINELNGETRRDNNATLTLICFPGGRPNRALAFIAGDTYLFHGNVLEKRMTRVEGNPDFIGKSDVRLEPKHIAIAPGDFFVIVSDGISSIRADGKGTSLEQALWQHLDGNLENFAFRAIESCNRTVEERFNHGVITRFGGHDNVSALLVCPEKLIDVDSKETFILGGYVLERTA